MEPKVSSDWLLKFRNYIPPDKRFDVVKHATKVFGAVEALRDFEGIGVVLDEVKPIKKVPKGLLEKTLDGACVAHFGRAGFYTDTSMVLIDCGHIQAHQFLEAWQDWYLSGRFKKGPQFHDGIGFDFALRQTQVPAVNLSGEHHKTQHPLKHTALGGWFQK